MQRGSTEVIIGVDGGKYPHGNSVVVRGSERRVIIDPSLSLWTHDAPRCRAGIAHSMCTRITWPVCRSTPILLSARTGATHHTYGRSMQWSRLFGFEAEANAEFAVSLVRDYQSFVARPDVESFDDDAVFDLGDGVTITAIPTPGHTGGHTAFLIEPDDVLVIGDIDLTGFGPYYADPISSLDEMVASMEKLRTIEAAWYVTFHHKGVIEGHTAFVEALDRFGAVVDNRDVAIVEYLAEPRSVGEMVAHRFLYRPHVELAWVDTAEERTTRQHLVRLVQRGQVTELGDDWFVAA